ncbi:hypothetical protein [Arthrobacter sp. 92]|uniref:hypothetical protein n=1 Tax=Arthrobacter sp. 92 TaxID=3418175 RepID=UPI003D00660D
MIVYRPIAPLTEGTGNGWRSVLAAVVMTALFGTAELQSPAPASASAGVEDSPRTAAGRIRR